MQQQQMQEEYLRQQEQWNLLQQQAAQEEWQRQQLATQQQQQQEEYLRQQQAQQLFFQQQQQQAQTQAFFQQQQQPQPLQAQPTGFGTKNPFAFPQNQTTSPPQPVPGFSASMPDLHSQQTPKRFNSVSIEAEDDDSMLLANTRANARRPYDDGENAHLAQLIAARLVPFILTLICGVLILICIRCALSEDGLDTFGNVGQLRFGHSNATGDAVPLVGQRTGTGGNPFAPLQQQRRPAQQTGGFDQPFFTV
jgi:epsin